MGFLRDLLGLGLGLGPSLADAARLRKRERLDRRSWALDWLEEAEFSGWELSDGADERCYALVDDMLDQDWCAFDDALQAEIKRSKVGRW